MPKARVFFWSKIVEIYQQVLSVFKNDPMVWILFIFLAILDYLALTVLFLAPSEPFSIILAPIIRAWWDERFLHYPENFSLLPKLFNHAHVVMTTIIGVYFTGLVVKKIQGQVMDGKKVTMRAANQYVMKKYLGIIVAWLISYAIFILAFKYLVPFFAKSLITFLAGSLVLAILVQSLTVFFIPALLISGKGFFKGLLDGLLFGIKNMITTAALIAVPMLVVVAVSYFKMLTPFYMRMNPELILIVLAVSIVFITGVDLVVTTTTTVLYLKERRKAQ